MRRWRASHWVLGLAALALGLAAPTAAAAPILEVDLDRTTTPQTHSDERTVYQVTVTNSAGNNPAVGDELTCETTVSDWFNVPTGADLAFQWLRNGAPIAGATTGSYTVLPADEGAALQCRVTGTNPSAERALVASEASVSAGSNVLSNVVTARGTGTLSSGSNQVTGVPAVQGTVNAFEPGQGISGVGIQLGTTITAVGPGTLELSAAATASGAQELSAGARPFAVGQSLKGTGIPVGTTIVAVSGHNVTMSANATASGAEVAVDAIEPTSASAIAVSLPPLVVSPSPFAPPPRPGGDPRAVESRPQVQDLSGSEIIFDSATRVCKAPTNWVAGASPFSGPWAYRWLRDGLPIPGATSDQYVPVEAEDKFAVLQCEVRAQSGSGSPPGGGTTVSVSPTSRWIATTTPAPQQQGYRPLRNAPNNNPVSQLPTVGFLNTTSGPVTVNLELPGGEETYVLTALGTAWACTKEPSSFGQHATAECTRSDPLPPGAAYPPIKLVERPGRDAPDTLVTKAVVSGGGALAPGEAEDSFTVGPAMPFGFEAFETEVLDQLGNDYTQAGGHPFSAGAEIAFKEHVKAEASSEAGFRAANGFAKVIETRTPRGFVGNPQAVPARCLTIADVVAMPKSTCPDASAVGGISIATSQGPFENLPIFSIVPEAGTPAEFGFGIATAGQIGYALTPELRADDGYAISLLTAPLQKNPEVFEADVTLCSFGVKLGTNVKNGETEFQGCREADDPEANPKPLITNPTRCSGSAPTTKISANTWEDPNTFASAEFTSPALTGCDAVEFEPTISLTPTSQQADSPTGMDVELTMPTDGLEDPTGIAQANLANSIVTLPVGMALNPSVASGLSACTPAQVKLGTNDEITCPPSSKVGSVEVETPLLAETLKGSVYVASQRDNPFATLLAIYMVLESKRDGILVKIAGKVAPDPVTGQLTASFKENPEAPVSRLSLHFASGARAPLINPPVCGTYRIEAQLSPWTAQDPGNPTPAETVTQSSSYQVTSGPNGKPCPDGSLSPRLNAGLMNPVAGATSPFVLDLSREDGSQRFSALNVAMPPGLTGYLKGIPYCPDATLAAIPTAEGTGAAQLASPSCPATSQLGSVSVGAGAGLSPFYVNTGKAYLAGPYKGAPLSIAIVTPAVAGPFDLGNVVVRNALQVNPKTAQISVVSDPIPTILHGLLLDVRDIRVSIDRPNFILAPTNCEPMTIGAQVAGEKGGLATLSNRFQVGGCAALPFKPNLTIQLHGGTRRGAYQRLVATVTAKPGEANIARTAVTFPHSAFLAQEHIVTVCTRVQFAAHQCPTGSVYGSAKVITPLLDQPLSGSVYLRSNPEQELPDLVAALRGPDTMPIEVELSGRTDSKNGGIRNTFDLVPDAPITKFTLQLKGGKRSLIVNSRDLCKGVQRATVRMTGQNGKLRKFRPRVANDCSKNRKPRRR